MVGLKPITFGEFLHFVGLWFLMATIIGPQQSDFWASHPIEAFHGAPEPCLTPPLMDEGQARNPNITYNGCIMEFWKFALTWKLICPVQHK